MNVQQSEMDREALVDPMESEDTRGLEVAAGVDVSVLRERSSSHAGSRHAPDRRVVPHLSRQRLYDEPLPHEVRGGIRVAGVALQVLDHERADRHRGQESDPQHALAHGRHELHGELIGESGRGREGRGSLRRCPVDRRW